jgi:hypothetical protein
VKPALFLRIASGLTLVHCVLHTVGGVFSAPRNGAEEIAVIDTMKSHHFEIFGSLRSYWDFHFGYGLFITINLLVQGLVFWQLATFVRTNGAWTKPLLVLFILNYVGMAVVSWRYFFLGPAVTELVIAAFLALACASAVASR